MIWKDAVRRAIRTFLQAFIGLLLASLAGEHLAPNTVPTWDVVQRLLIASAFGATIALLAWLQNYLEDNTNFPALLKAPPSAGANPEPKP